MKRFVRVISCAAVIFLLAATLSTAGGRTERTEAAAPAEITIGLLARGISDALFPYLDQFEQETGIRVNIEQHAFDSLRDKMMLEFAAGSGYFDIIYLSPGYLGELVENDYIMPLNDLMAQHGFRRDEFLPAGIEINRYGEGEEIWGFPYLADTTILLYRKDLFNDSSERAAFRNRYGYDLPIPGVENPLTTRQFHDLAEFFTRDGMYGFGYPQTGVAYGNLHIMPWIWTFGGEYYDGNLNATLNRPNVVEAVRYARGLQNFQPPGVLGWDYGDHIPRFYEGDLAMTAGWFHMGLDANNPEISAVAGNVGYAPMPYHPEAGIGSAKAVLGGGGVAITAHSRNPEAAFTYLNWMFGNTDRALEWYLNGGGATRPEIYEHRRVHEEYPWAAEFFPVANYSLDRVAKQRPTLPNSHELFEVMSEMWHNVALDRMSPQEGVRWAHGELDRLLAPWR